jgi:hypothetical protein
VQLASGKNLRDAASAAGVSERTATRRWADPAFKQYVTDLQAEARQRALGRIADTMTKAADTLEQLLTAECERVRLGASRAILELGVKAAPGADDDGTTAAVNVNVTAKVELSVEQVLRDYRDVIEEERVPREAAHVERSQQPVHSPKTDAQTGRIPPRHGA